MDQYPYQQPVNQQNLNQPKVQPGFSSTWKIIIVFGILVGICLGAAGLVIATSNDENEVSYSSLTSTNLTSTNITVTDLNSTDTETKTLKVTGTGAEADFDNSTVKNIPSETASVGGALPSTTISDRFLKVTVGTTDYFVPAYLATTISAIHVPS